MILLAVLEHCLLAERQAVGRTDGQRDRQKTKVAAYRRVVKNTVK